MPDNTQKSSELISIYSEGDIAAEWVPGLVSHEIEMLQGVWEVMPERSDTCDEIMSALNIGLIQRSALRRYRSRVDIQIVPEGSGKAPKVYIRTNLPMGFVKEGTVYTDGRSFEFPVSLFTVYGLRFRVWV